MARQPKLLEASFEQVLLYADEPQVILLSAIADSKLIAVAINYEGYKYGFFAAQISSAQFADYMNQRFDLRYLLLMPAHKRHFVFDLSQMDDGVVKLSKITLDKENSENFLPDQGLFSRDHTEDFQSTLRTAQTEQIFGVDGSWDLPEFSRFYSNITDLYAFFNSVDAFLDEQTSIDKKRKIKRAFAKPFEGGGSYVSLYDSLLNTQSKENMLHVGGISYNSPGYIKIRGFENPFVDIKSLLDNLSSNIEEIDKLYKDLNKFLRKNGLSKYPAENFTINNPMSVEVLGRSKMLADSMVVVDYNTVLKMASDNILVAAKVLLSLFRRATRLYQFFLEGRANLEEVPRLT